VPGSARSCPLVRKCTRLVPAARPTFVAAGNTKSPLQGFPVSPLTDSNRRPPPYHGGSGAVLASIAGHSRPRSACKLVSYGSPAVPVRARACPRVPVLMYPSRTRGALPVHRTGPTTRSCPRHDSLVGRNVRIVDDHAEFRVVARAALQVTGRGSRRGGYRRIAPGRGGETPPRAGPSSTFNFPTSIGPLETPHVGRA